MRENLPYIVSAGALILAIINALYSRKRDTQGDWERRVKELTDDLKDVSKRLIILEAQSAIFFKGLSVSTAQALHSPHTPELDLLLEAFQQDRLKDEKAVRRLKQLLNEILKNDKESAFRKKLAHDVLTLVQVRYEIGGELLLSMEGHDKQFSDDIHNLSRRLER